MKESFKKRWKRWDRLLNSNNYSEVIYEYNKLIEKHTPLYGDVIRWKQALEAKLNINKIGR